MDEPKDKPSNGRLWTLRDQIAAEVEAKRPRQPEDDEQSFKLLNPRWGKPRRLPPPARQRRSKYA